MVTGAGSIGSQLPCSSFVKRPVAPAKWAEAQGRLCGPVEISATVAQDCCAEVKMTDANNNEKQELKRKIAALKKELGMDEDLDKLAVLRAQLQSLEALKAARDALRKIK
jgi:hypothetical protein